jgi:hypothetical protein
MMVKKMMKLVDGAVPRKPGQSQAQQLDRTRQQAHEELFLPSLTALTALSEDASSSCCANIRIADRCLWRCYGCATIAGAIDYHLLCKL